MTSTINTTTGIELAAGQTYEIACFVYPTSLSTPGSAVTLAVVGGSGNVITENTFTVNTVQNVWNEVKSLYQCINDETVTLSIVVTGIAIGGTLNFADLTMQPLTAPNAGAWEEYNIAQVRDLANIYTSIFDNFVVNSKYSTWTNIFTAGSDQMIINGKFITTIQQSFIIANNTTFLIFYDTWTGSYVAKTYNSPDATQMILYSVSSDSSGVITVSELFDVQPLDGTQIEDGTITGVQIAANTIPSSALLATGVIPASYGINNMIGGFQVNSEGQIEIGSNQPINFPVTSVNGLRGDVPLSLGMLNGVTLTSPASGQYLSYNGNAWINATSPIGYYQTVSSVLTSVMQRPLLNFNSIFTITDDGTNNCSTIDITNNAITYSKLQQVSTGAVLLGNAAAGSAGNIGEVAVGSSLVLNGSLGINYIINAQTAASYTILTSDFNGQTIITSAYSNTGAVTFTLPVGSGLMPGAILRIIDISGGAAKQPISIIPQGSDTINGTTTAQQISTNYGHLNFFWSGSAYFLI